MLSDAVPVRCSILRGGTSKAVFFLSNDLPADRPSIEPLLLSIFGSPDIRQIDGLGGATSQTSKAAIIGPPSRPDADVDYTFAQEAVVNGDGPAADPVIRGVAIGRTARHILDGQVWVPRRLLSAG